MKYLMYQEEFVKYQEKLKEELEKLNESRTSEEAMKNIINHDLYFVIRIELIKLLRINKKAEYTRLYTALENKSIVSCVRKKDGKLYELPHGVYVTPQEGFDLEKVEEKVLEALEECLKPLYPNTYRNKYTTLISGPARITFQNLEEIDLEFEN